MAAYLKLAITQTCHYCGYDTGDFGVADLGDDTVAFCRSCGEKNGLGIEGEITDYEWHHELKWHELHAPVDLPMVGP